MAALSVTGEVYCFPRRQIIFSFDRRVIGISIERFARVHSKIDFVCPSVCTTIFERIA